MRDDNERRKHTISHEAYAQHRALDEQHRQLSQWLNDEKLKVMEQYAPASSDPAGVDFP